MRFWRGAAPNGQINAIRDAFLDQAGVMFLRREALWPRDLEGRLVGCSANPRGTTVNTTDRSQFIVQVVQVPGRLRGDHQRGKPWCFHVPLCLITQDAWPELSACTLLPTYPRYYVESLRLGWQRVPGSSRWTVWSRTIPRGSWSRPEPLALVVVEAPLAAQYVGRLPAVRLDWRDSKALQSESLWVLPRSLDMNAVAKTDLHAG